MSGIFEFNTQDDEIKLERPNELLEAYIVDEVSCLDDQSIQEFCTAGGVGEQLVQEGKLRKQTLVRLSKKDDLERRQTMAELQLAKEDNGTLWKKLLINRNQKRKLMQDIKKKYGNKAKKVSMTSQREYLKGGPKGQGVLPASFKKAGGADRVSRD